MTTASNRWRLLELTGRQLVLVKDFLHKIKSPPNVGEKVAVVIASNRLALYAVPACESWPPNQQDLMLYIPPQGVTLENLADVFPAAVAAEIYHAFRLNRKHLLHLVVNNTSPERQEGGVA